MILSEILSTVVRMHPARPALRMDRKSYSYADVYEWVDALAGALVARDVKPGDRVALLGPPCPELFIAEFAAVALGAIPFGIFYNLALPEIQSIVEDADPVVLVYTPDMAAIMGKLVAPSLKLRVCTEEGGDHLALATLTVDSVSLRRWHQASPDEPTLLIYTGGTTGRSKGVIHTHRSICHWTGIVPPDGFGLEPENKRLATNIAHITGQFDVWTSVSTGRCTIFPGSQMKDVSGVLDLIEAEQITHVGLMGAGLREAVNLPNVEQRNFNSLKLMGHGAAPTSFATLQRAAALFPNAVVLEGYAQTESGMIPTLLNVSACVDEGQHLERLNSVGTTATVAELGQIPMKIKIVDAAGDEVMPGDIGEVVLQGPQMMTGYWQNPEATQATIRDGWLYTGDVGSVDEDGYLYLADRIKDMVIVGASNVYTSEVERILVDHPSIAELCILGTSLHDEGEAVTAVAVLRPNASLSLEDVWQHCDGKIARYKFPTRLEIVDELPKTPVNKLDKRKLKQQLIEIYSE